MKNLIFLLTLVSTLFFASCDLCEDVDCNNGDCKSGECFCDTGYYGDACEIGYIDALLEKGTWLVNLFETDPDGEYLGSYFTTVQAVPNNQLSFTIPEFYEYEGDILSIVGYVGDNWEVTFPERTENGITISGSGTMFQLPVSASHSGHYMKININVSEAFLSRTFGLTITPN